MEKLCYATDEERDTFYAILKACDARKAQQDIEAAEKRESANKLREEIKIEEELRKREEFEKVSHKLAEKIQNIQKTIDETKQFIDENNAMITPYKQKLHDNRVNFYNTQKELRDLCYDHELKSIDRKKYLCTICRTGLR